jgi:hypothetical protein
MTTADNINLVLMGHYDASTRYLFVERFSDQLDLFTARMVTAFSSWHAVDKIVCSEPSHAHISAVLYAALNAHVVSMKLLMEGLLIPSGNSQRYVLESLALGLLISQPSKECLQRYSKGEYQTSKAISDALANSVQLKLSAEELGELALFRKFYHYASHPSLESLASVMTVNAENQPITLLGGIFDEQKMDIYDKEITSRVSLAEILPTFIDHIRQLYLSDLNERSSLNPGPSSSPISSLAWRA